MSSDAPSPDPNAPPVEAGMQKLQADMDRRLSRLEKDDFSVDRPMPAQGVAPITGAGAAPVDVRQLSDICSKFAGSALCKARGFDTPQDIFFAAMVGIEMGFSVTQALQTLYNVKGKVSIPGEAIAAVINGSDRCEYFDLDFEGEPGSDAWCAVVRSKRVGRETPYPEVRFSLAQAKAALLYDVNKKDKYGQPSVWVKYTEDMLGWKAIARAGRRSWGDLVHGLAVLEDTPGYGEGPAGGSPIDITPPGRDARPGQHPAFAAIGAPAPTVTVPAAPSESDKEPAPASAPATPETSASPLPADVSPTEPTPAPEPAPDPLPDDLEGAQQDFLERVTDRAIALRMGIMDDDTAALEKDLLARIVKAAGVRRFERMTQPQLVEASIALPGLE